MLVFKKRPILDSTFDHLVYGLANNNKAESVEIDDSLILITESTFENLNFGKVLSTLSLLNSALTTLPIVALPALRYPTFDNHGSVLNLQGFPGGVKVSGSTFKNNLVYISDIFPS